MGPEPSSVAVSWNGTPASSSSVKDCGSGTGGSLTGVTTTVTSAFTVAAPLDRV